MQNRSYCGCLGSKVGCSKRRTLTTQYLRRAQVAQGDVDEALRLMNMSKISLEDDDVQEAVSHDPVRDAFGKARVRPVTATAVGHRFRRSRQAHV